MSLYFGCYTNVLWACILFFLVQCLIISENKVHADTNHNAVTKGSNDSKISNVSQNKTAKPENQSVGLLSNVKSKVNNSEKAASSVHNSETVTPNKNDTDTSTVNSAKAEYPKNISTGAVVRGFYVFVGLGAIVVMYIVVRTIRLKRKKTTVRKYGILASREDVEMTPLGAEDDEEDTTLFDMSSQKSRP